MRSINTGLLLAGVPGVSSHLELVLKKWGEGMIAVGKQQTGNQMVVLTLTSEAMTTVVQSLPF